MTDTQGERNATTVATDSGHQLRGLNGVILNRLQTSQSGSGSTCVTDIVVKISDIALQFAVLVVLSLSSLIELIFCSSLARDVVVRIPGRVGQTTNRALATLIDRNATEVSTTRLAIEGNVVAKVGVTVLTIQVDGTTNSDIAFIAVDHNLVVTRTSSNRAVVAINGDLIFGRISPDFNLFLVKGNGIISRIVFFGRRHIDIAVASRNGDFLVITAIRLVFHGFL